MEYDVSLQVGKIKYIYICIVLSWQPKNFQRVFWKIFEYREKFVISYFLMKYHYCNIIQELIYFTWASHKLIHNSLKL